LEAVNVTDVAPLCYTILEREKEDSVLATLIEIREVILYQRR